MSLSWDYLIVTASNDAQAQAYQSQLALRQRLGLLPRIAHAMVVADPGGKRIGSGGSTLFCLIQVLDRELEAHGGHPADQALLEKILRHLRILIIHAGGDSRRLPAYGPCGKIFVPVPAPTQSPAGITLFDRLLDTFIELPPGLPGCGQIVVTSGDALILFDPAAVSLAHPGLTALGSYATPDAASKHGVFAPDPTTSGRVRLYFQKPKPAEQAAAGAIDPQGRSVLDIGVMSFDAAFAIALFNAFQVAPDSSGRLIWSPHCADLILNRGLDLYREICCALGTGATGAHHLASARASGSTWDEPALAQVHRALSPIPFSLCILPQSRFLHFGTTRQLITSGQELVQHDQQTPAPSDAHVAINNAVQGAGRITGPRAWVEGCQITAPLTLAGDNVVVGVDIDQPLQLPANACIDMILGHATPGQPAWFVRCYGIADTFKDTGDKATYCGMPIARWLSLVGAPPEEIWDASIPANQRSLWNARVFPAEPQHAAFHQWLWVFDPAAATPAQKKAFLQADRYSVAQIALLTQQDAFYTRRAAIRQGQTVP